MLNYRHTEVTRRMLPRTASSTRLGVKDNPRPHGARTHSRIRDDHKHVFWLDEGAIRYTPGHEFETPAWTIGRIDSWNDAAGAEARLCAALT